MTLAMLNEVRRLRKSIRPPRATLRQALASKLYGPDHPALRRVLADPAGLQTIAELELDLLLASPAALARIGRGSEALRAFLDGCGAWMLRRLDAGRLGEPLLIYGQRPPESLEEACWLAGTTGTGLYLADLEPEPEPEPEPDVMGEFRWPDRPDRLAIRSEDGVISTRKFSELWQVVGTVEKG